ncbi:hypothetical protein SUGI_0594560 [Cryptomeria japonica]|uniref:uncharacterized protein LOC131054403 isoform X1 n=1 Tax=Cryptomeria japonica TaxID=3369 RepID=UPI002414CAFC|nr:uncharacterized protein LOC131054403 isoform X1 [Cryptomeria japonica]GLJ30066.1 hypothetical protein SUGI_0594560 [Cryptomeria japonica]
MAKVLSNTCSLIDFGTNLTRGFTAHGFPRRFKQLHHNWPFPVLSNRFLSSTPFLARLQLRSTSFEAQARKLPCFLAMGELGQEDKNSLSFQGVVLPATEIYVEKAVEALRAGKVIAVPTDTLYGLACDACSSAAVQKIYEIKGRSITSPLAVCVSDVLDVDRFAITSHLPDGLLQCLLPGPVTLVLDRGQESLLEKSLNPGIDTIGIRIPECDFIRMIAQDFGSALALTSANQSGHSSTVCIEEFKQLWQECAYIFDGGQLPVGRAGSTVIDLTRPNLYKILRPGSALKETTQILDRFGWKETS